MSANDSAVLPFSSQFETISQLLTGLEEIDDQDQAEQILTETLSAIPDQVAPNSSDYYAVLNAHLYRHILKHYKHQEEQICLWRYIKNLSDDQLSYAYEGQPELKMLDHLVKIYFYSDPLDDLTCLFIPISDNRLIKKHLDWIKNYFYDVNYPTSLLWLYALDSSLASLFPHEIIYIGKRLDTNDEDIIIPDFENDNAVLIKRYSNDQEHYVELSGHHANSEFQQIFTFLQQEYKDRCLSRSGKQDDDVDDITYLEEWEKFEDVLRYGVSDKSENGCVGFSDLRSSTEFLNAYGKITYLNKIQQPFFENTKLISRRYNGRIDKFMGDNVMCVFLNNNMAGASRDEREKMAILNNLFSVFNLCQVLYDIIKVNNFGDSNLGLRSGLTYGRHILRSNLGNEIVRDFTVTGETVNLAARLEHISVHELTMDTRIYFKNSIDRFPQIHELLAVTENYQNLNPETQLIIQEFTLYQNIISNLEKLGRVKFDIRFNQEFYQKLRAHLLAKGYKFMNPDTSEIYGYEKFEVEGFELYFYFSYYNPKGFSQYEKIWILPLELELLEKLDIETIR